MKDLHWLPLGAPIDFKILLLTFRILNDSASYYLSSFLLKYQRARLLRLSNGLLLQVPSVNTVTLITGTAHFRIMQRNLEHFT